MAKTNTADKKRHKAEVHNPETGQRRRTYHRTWKAARRATWKGALEEEQRAQLKTTTFGEAALAFIDSRDAARAKVGECIYRVHLKSRIGQCTLRSMSRERIVSIAKSIMDIKLGEARRREILGFFFTVLRDAFMDVPLSVRYACEIPGLLPRKGYGEASMVTRTRAIPIGKDLDRRLDESTGVLRIALWIMAHAGLRIGEARALRGADVDFEKKLIHVHATITLKGNRRKEPKSKAGFRSVPINSELMKVLKAWLADRDPESPVLSERGGALLSYRQLVWLNTCFCKDLGIAYYSLHLYRSACVTIWLFGNVPLRLICIWIGHSRPSTTVQIYGNAIAVADELWVNRLNSVAGPKPSVRVQQELLGISCHAVAKGDMD